ncbi:MAG: LysR family transcriptional regulator [Eggerthellaceae bacterium]|nr:LysR family transcriptional regulator [Eggerthellaceae bacterium]
MKLQYLSEFVMLAHTLNFSIAAKRLHISQPVLSTHIKTMETELGFELFVRNRRSVALSEIGKEILPEMVEVVERYHDALDTAQKFLDAQSSKLTIGYLYNAFRDLLPSLSREFSNEHPGIDFRMHSFGYQGITNAMYQDAIDVAFTIDVDESLNDLCHIVKLKEDPICCVVRSDDPLAKYKTLSINDLRGESFILPHPDDSANLAFFYDELFQKSGFTPHISMQYREIDTRYLAIESGEGVALVGRHFQQFMGDDVVFIPFAESFWKYDLCAMWKKSNPNKSIPALMELVTEAFGLEA